jgi:formylglycine-generating enzyme required for sulfatase activity
MRLRGVVLSGVLAAALACGATAAGKPTRTPTPTPKKKQTPQKTPPAKKPVAKKPPVKNPAPVPTIALEAERFSRINSLGMKFVRAGEIEMCIWPVRRSDFEKYATAVSLDADGEGRWRRTGFPQTPEHPVVNVSWRDAAKFCAWLTASERASGKLGAESEYRLPTDGEWSRAVGLANELGATPEERDLSDAETYPWGKQWPPPPGAGNLAGAETAMELAIEGFRDDFAHTSPVGSFSANALGLHDMAGNVFQWCRDPIRGGASERTLRGSSWYSGAIQVGVLSSSRIKAAPETVNDSFGFRVVVAPVKPGGASVDGN